ncbi:hypothetical protein P280DRAFT_531914 [Massarina eburnea CBS 473.64]|uniref:Uncharacterized protein n=1 Tax=Massarina eburnea CBS 473.64 TaxID=1395130 RepID=A0A6A6SEV6_9PLEO|nr:hypothetical protein P280DRAFT_531914 [Massarina eburnea CBS 473.64]
MEESLFIPEERDPSLFPVPKKSLQLPTPADILSHATAGPSRSSAKPALSTFSKIRALQAKIKKDKIAASKPSHSYHPAPDEETYLEAIQSPTAEIPNWDDYDGHDRKLAAEYQKQKIRYDTLKRKNGGHLTFREQIEWHKICETEQRRKTKKERNAQMAKEDGEPDLFPDICVPSSVGLGNQSDDEIADISSPNPLRRKRPKLPRKEVLGLSIQEAELMAVNVALEASGDLPKGKKKRKTALEDSSPIFQPSTRGQRPKSSKSKATASSSGSGLKRPRQSTKGKANAAKAIKQATSLFTANVFAQQSSNRSDTRSEPSFHTRNKQDAMKELIAAVPLESLKQAKDDKAALLQATREFDGKGSVKPDGHGMWLVKGMKTSLKGYQILGSGFMRRRETASEEPRGGLMADTMGLGKTLMMLANIVNGHPGNNAPIKTTLLVASPALLTQWSREIELHTNRRLIVMKYASGNRIDSNRTEEVLNHHDIILTTYAEIMRSYPKNEPPIECQSVEQKISWWKYTYETQRGALHRMMFHRIVLDEAQAIKNHTGRTSIACRALMAHHKWALSGTPILNSLTELYPYFKFLGVPHTGSFKIFKNNYCEGSNSETSERLLVRLSQFMIRRTHADEMFGAPILRLPEATQTTFQCEFNAVERSIYDIVRARFVKNINMLAKRDNESTKSYNNGLVMLLRLRQLTSSLLMLQFVLQDLAEREDLEKIRDVVNEAAGDRRTGRSAMIIGLREQLKNLSSEEKRRNDKKNPSAFRDGEDYIPDLMGDDDDAAPDEAERDLAVHSGRNFGKEFNFKPYLNSLTTGANWEKINKKAKCIPCGRHPNHGGNSWITGCGHILCTDCYEKAQIKQAEEDRENPTCAVCGVISTRWRMVSILEGEERFGKVETRSECKARADKVRLRIEQQDINDEWLNFGGEGVLPSAKTIAVKAQILNWVKENPDVKIIIYTQFLAMIRILAKVCQEEGWLTEQYHGKMSFAARDKAIQHFADNQNVKVLLASLRCGGLGLNLTMASRVIVIDPWWNSATEQQAFCRVFRFGQQSATSLTRLVVKDSVDERLIQMQDKKQKEIDEVMEDKNQSVGAMSLRDLMRLFGNLQDDEKGRPYILVDNPDPRGGFRADGDDEGFADDI